MKTVVALLGFVFAASPSIPYFKYQRPVPAAASGQQYFVVDETVWKHALPNLEDLRLYAGQTEVPYALTIERGNLEQDHKDVRVLQQSRAGGKTQFLIDMSGVSEYDHINLNLSAKNFVAHAVVEGQDDLHGQHWVTLTDPILYDLSSEGLGSNSVLRLPLTTYHYLRVTIDGPVKPTEVLGATSETRQEQKAVWRNVGGEPQIGQYPGKSTRTDDGRTVTQKGKGTLLTFVLPENVPIERIVFDIDPSQPNFRRDVEIQNETGAPIGSGEINRIHMVRGGNKIDSEQQSVGLSATGKTLIVIIYNGDDLPLKLKGARLQHHVRRVYFDGAASSPLALYYGDEKLESPIYDYAKLFQQDKNAVPAQLGGEVMNAAYAGRPDDRPWSERHPAVLWIAIVAAVLALGAVALRSMKTAAA